ncbi:cation diffusion facilitator family transporter [Methylorubrum populi]|nr:cation diffusion facilitator family transporter [Methylorubrum populi]
MTGHADHASRDGGGHEHGHAHAPANFGKAFAVGIGLNVAFVLIEGVYGVLSNSLALVADAGHNLSDVLGLAVAWAAAVLGKRAPTPRYTYGMKGSSILAALFNAVILLVAMGAIAWEAVRRFGEPAPVAGTTVMVVAGIGILINGITAWLFASGREGDLNVKGAFLHMAADAAVSAGVVVAGLLIALTGWRWLDPVTSLLIAAAVVWSTWGLLRDSVRMSLAAVPPGIDPDAVRAHLRGLEGVTAVHDFHVWPMSTTEVALTSHLVRPDGTDDAFLIRAARELRDRFGIVHVTLQVETSEATACALAPDGVV